jgi:hypothetical protein
MEVVMQAAIGASAIGETAIGEALNRDATKNIVFAQINPTGLSDVPTDKDGIGFHPYTRAIAWFLANEKTKPPLTLSIEGPWGSGKSSFMLQLEQQLKSQKFGEKRQYFIKFNAWRCDKDEALWAAFALTFIKQLEPQIRFFKRALANAALVWKRVDWGKNWFYLTLIAIFWAVFLGLAVVLTLYAARHLDVAKDDANVNIILIGIPWLAAAYFGLEKAEKIVGNPLSYNLSKYVRDLKYEEKVAFIDRFRDDFADIVRSYVGEQGRIFIFIDDLDRCEIPRAAELLQAINLLLSADQGNLFFILGLDREMVAAGIAAKNEKILPYLAAGRSAKTPEKQEFYRIGVEYGYSFMEKFVQVPFRVPRPDEREITHWVSELTDPGAVSETMATQSSRRRDSIDIRAGSDPDQFDEVVQKMAQLFGFNPRRLKQFVNVFRLRVMIALSTDVLAPAKQYTGGVASSDGITIQQLGLFTAILMRWSRLAGDLVEEPNLLNQLISSPNQPVSRVSDNWAAEVGLREAINFDPNYSLLNVNLRPLLMIMPDSYSGMLSEGAPGQPRTRLVAGGGVQMLGTPSPSAEVPQKANTSPQPSGPPDEQVWTGPTGPTGPSSKS